MIRTVSSFALTAVVAFVAAAPAAAQGALTSAQRNYKRCPEAALSSGVEVVKPFCGPLAAAPDMPDYDAAWGRITRAELKLRADTRNAYAATVAKYTQCIDARVMGDGSLPTETLDQAACAHQEAGERVTDTNARWGEACLAFEDTSGERFSEPCFPQG